MQIKFDLRENEFVGWQDKINLVEIIGTQAYVEGKKVGTVPVSKTPAFYDLAKDEIVYGYSEIMGKIKDEFIGNKIRT